MVGSAEEEKTVFLYSIVVKKIFLLFIQPNNNFQCKKIFFIILHGSLPLISKVKDFLSLHSHLVSVFFLSVISQRNPKVYVTNVSR